MTKTRALALAFTLAILTGCGGNDNGKTDTPATTEPAEIEWTTAMQNACTAEAEALTKLATDFETVHGTAPSNRHLEAEGLLTGDTTYWKLQLGKLEGTGDNTDERCGGMYLP